jgi:acetylornithine deacetylase/succinyl-diaminopimelate desuccinylase-like protein
VSSKTAQFWDDAIVPALVDYIRIPAKSPHFDHDWRAHGYIEDAAKLAAAWCERNPVPGMKLEIVRLGERTPCLFIDVPGTAAGGPVLMYGHLDKQPEMTGWREGLGPWVPVMEDGKLYGRGGADDGYAVFCAIAALRQLHEEKRPHRRCVILIECCEESGSFDLPPYLDALAPRIGTPSLVVALDSGCGNYNQLWGTTSLRGLLNGVLTVEVLTEGVHSGDASGVVASSFRIARALIDRIDDSRTGAVVKDFHVDIPGERKRQAELAAQVLGDEVWRKFPFVPGMKAMGADNAERILNRTWRPMLAVTGADGLPAPANAGNVLRPKTQIVLSLRLPPTLDAQRAAEKMKTLLESDPPYGARVRYEYGQAARGWNAPALVPWLERTLDESSRRHYGQPAMWMGEGGTIPFMAMLGEKFPQAQFFITGVLGPHSNAHGPNEFLHLDYAKRLTACVADVLTAHAAS